MSFSNQAAVMRNPITIIDDNNLLPLVKTIAGGSQEASAPGRRCSVPICSSKSKIMCQRTTRLEIAIGSSLFESLPMKKVISKRRLAFYRYRCEQKKLTGVYTQLYQQRKHKIRMHNRLASKVLDQESVGNLLLHHLSHTLNDGFNRTCMADESRRIDGAFSIEYMKRKKKAWDCFCSYIEVAGHASNFHPFQTVTNCLLNGAICFVGGLPGFIVSESDAEILVEIPQRRSTGYKNSISPEHAILHYTTFSDCIVACIRIEKNQKGTLAVGLPILDWKASPQSQLCTVNFPFDKGAFHHTEGVSSNTVLGVSISLLNFCRRVASTCT